MKEEFICSQCKQPMKDEGFSGVCYDCYAEIWDSGFESTSDHAYKIGFNELLEKLTQPVNNEVKKTISEIVSEWGPLLWKCGKCGEVRITLEESKILSPEEKIMNLSRPCPGCGADGHMEPERPHKYFH